MQNRLERILYTVSVGAAEITTLTGIEAYQCHIIVKDLAHNDSQALPQELMAKKKGEREFLGKRLVKHLPAFLEGISLDFIKSKLSPAKIQIIIIAPHYFLEETSFMSEISDSCEHTW